jgi:hypothetical protein
MKSMLSLSLAAATMLTSVSAIAEKPQDEPQALQAIVRLANSEEEPIVQKINNNQIAAAPSEDVDVIEEEELEIDEDEQE